MGHELEADRERQGESGSRRDAGYTLTEVLAAVVLMGIAIIPIILAAGLSLRTSSQSRNLGRIETVLANAADRVNRAAEGGYYLIYAMAATLAEWNEKSLATAS